MRFCFIGIVNFLVPMIQRVGPFRMENSLKCILRDDRKITFRILKIK